MFLTRLIEVGRKISKANRAKLHAAMEKLRELIDEAVETNASEADRSYSDKEKLLRDAIKAKLTPMPIAGVTPYFYCYIQDLFDTWCVFTTDEGMFKIDYVIGSDGAVTLGEPREVIARTVYDDAPVREAAETPLLGDCVPLVEAEASVPLSESATATLKLISPGWGSSGYYSPTLLKNAAAKFAKGMKMYWNHQTAAEEAARPEGDLDRLAGELIEDAVWNENGPTGPGIYAKAKVFDRFTPHVKDLAPHIGVSIRASGLARTGEAEGRKGPVIETITGVKSVDYVTVPGRGGEILSLFEAAGRRPATEPPNNEENVMNEAQVKALLEAALTPLRAENAASKAEAARLRETLALRDARDFAKAKLAKIDLPQATKDRLAESLPSQATLKDGALDEAAFAAVIEAAVKAEGEYLKSVGIGTGRISGMGLPAPVSEAVKPEALAAQFRAMGLSEAAARIAAEGRAA